MNSDIQIPRVGLTSSAEVGIAGLFKVRLLLGEDGRKRFLPAEVADRLGADAKGAK
jgi:hypothetical protein